MIDQMSDADFLRASLEHMGSPERWCKKNYVTFKDGSTNNNDMSVRLVFDNKEKIESISSMCLEGAMLMQLSLVGDVEWHFWSSLRLIRLNRLINEEFKEQFPDLFDSMEFARVNQYNDHPAMTYEGVRSVVEKTIAKLEEGQV